MRQLREGKISIWLASGTAGMIPWDFLTVVKKEQGIEWVKFGFSQMLNNGL